MTNGKMHVIVNIVARIWKVVRNLIIGNLSLSVLKYGIWNMEMI